MGLSHRSSPSFFQGIAKISNYLDLQCSSFFFVKCFVYVNDCGRTVRPPDPRGHTPLMVEGGEGGRFSHLHMAEDALPSFKTFWFLSHLYKVQLPDFFKIRWGC